MPAATPSSLSQAGVPPSAMAGVTTESGAGLSAAVQAVSSKASTPPSVGSWRKSLSAWSVFTRLGGRGAEGGTWTPGRSGAIPPGRIR